MDENAYALGMQVASLVTEMKHVREDLHEIKRAVTDAIPALDKRITTLEAAPHLEARVAQLEAAQLVWKTRLATVVTIGMTLGGGVVWAVEHFLIKP